MGDPRRGGTLSRDYGYTGGSYEVDLFGGLMVSDAYKKELAQSANEKGYLPRDFAMKLIRKYYLEDPTHPKKPFASEFRNHVAKLLKIVSPEDQKRLRFYSAVGKKDVSPLDFFHGIDAWIELAQEKGDPIVVTIDATMREQKDDAKADLLARNIPDPSEDRAGFQIMIEQLAERAAILLGADIKRETSTTNVRLSSGIVRRVRKTS